MKYFKIFSKGVSVFAIIFILLQSCFFNDDITPDYLKIKISYISGIGHISYEKGLISSIGDEKLIYDKYGHLVASRIHEIDTSFNADSSSWYIYEALEKYSYIWENNLIVGIVADSILERSETDTNYFNEYSLYTNLPVSVHYYSGIRLDSVGIFNPLNTESKKMIFFEYDEKGNIRRNSEYLSPPSDPNDPYEYFNYSYERSVTEFSGYDNKPNPFNIIFKQLGVIIPALATRNISINNPLASTTNRPFLDTWMQIDNSYEYIYNKDGLPIVIMRNKGESNELTTLIEYY